MRLEIRFPRVDGYRVELLEERLSTDFKDDPLLELTPELTGVTETQTSGIIGEGVNLNLVHTGDVRPSQVLYELTYLSLNKWRDLGGEAPASNYSANLSALRGNGLMAT